MLFELFFVFIFFFGCMRGISLNQTNSRDGQAAWLRSQCPKVSHKHSCQNWHTIFISAHTHLLVWILSNWWFALGLRVYSGKPTQEHSSFYQSIISFLGLKVKCIGHQILFVHRQTKCRNDSGFSLQFMISYLTMPNIYCCYKWPLALMALLLCMHVRQQCPLSVGFLFVL